MNLDVEHLSLGNPLQAAASADSVVPEPGPPAELPSNQGSPASQGSGSARGT
jgi:hypothetical protein